MKIELMDKFYFPETERSYTEEGYLVVPATISRPGTQVYKAIELVPSEDKLPMKYRPNDPIVVYRPPEEVFKQESVDSFKNIAVTNNHPPEFLNSKNYRKYSVGIMLSDVHPDEDKFVKGTVKITDYETINEVKDGKVDISAGYNSNVYFEEGETPSGEKYQAIQRDISGNHVAIVTRGRAGSEVKLADGLDRPSDRSETLVAEGVKRSSGTEASEAFGEGRRKSKGSEEEEFGMDGVPGSNALNPFGDEKEKTSTDVVDEKNKDVKELTMKLEDAMTKIGELEKANEKLSSQVLDQASLDSLVEDRMQVIDACSQLVNGMEYIGKSNLDLKKEVLSSKMPNINLEDKSADYVNAAFDVMKAGLNDSVAGEHDKDVYGEDLSLKDEEGVETPEGEEKPAETTKNVHEGENPDEHVEEEAESGKDEDPKLETKDSVSVLDSAFESEAKIIESNRELSAYEKYCLQSRDAWKKK